MDTNTNPLTVDLSTVKTDMPVLQGPQTLDLKVEKSDIVPTKSGGKMWKLELSTMGPAQAVDGSMLGAGVRVFHQENFIPTGKLTLERCIQGVARIVQAAAMTLPPFPAKDLAQVIEANHKQIEGRSLRCRISYVPAGANPTTGKTYREKNEVTAFIKK